MGCSVHHELLGLEVVCLSDEVGYNVRVFGQQGLVVYFLPFKPLAELCVRHGVRGSVSNSWEPEVLQVKVTDKVELPVYKELLYNKALTRWLVVHRVGVFLVDVIKHA
jgi:hypothetical protein